jgi:Protein of unknown function (DUF2946)
MFRQRCRREFTTRLMVWVLLAASMAPLVSRAMDRAGTRAWVEVCSSQGSRWVRADDAAGGVAGRADMEHALDHCALCLLQDNTPWAPIAPKWPQAMVLAVAAAKAF